MILLGILFIIFFGLVGFVELIDEMEITKIGVVCLLGLVIGIGFVSYDVKSPVVETEKIIITNDYEKYDLEIDSDRIGKVKVVKKDPTRVAAIHEDGTEYTFIDFVE